MNRNAGVSKWTGARSDARVIDVTMLGAVGTGKTTLLASMYERFGRVIGTTDLSVLPSDQRTSVRLQNYITDLQKLTDTVRARGGLAGQADVREYLFEVGRRGRPPLFNLRFTDYPGKYLIDPDGDSGGKLQRALDRADVVLVAIDAPALMERHGRHHEFINTPQLVIDMIMRMFARDTDRLVLLVPLKCESYVGTPEGAKRLADRMIEAYQPLLDQISSGLVRSRAACVLTPVQTVGSVVFYALEEDVSGHPTFHFRIKQRGAVYAPVDTDQLLRYTLGFVVNKYRASERGLLRTIWEQVIGTDLALVAAVDDFASGCKTADGFKVLQGHPLLPLGRFR